FLSPLEAILSSFNWSENQRAGHKPVTVTWVWGTEEDPATKAITMPREKHSVQVNFPAGGPHRDLDWRKSDAYLCVILRDLNTAELAFSPTGSGCMSK
ncbi:MAG: hypothetical protein V4803_18015, partial [Burkholderia gladioli]